MSTPQRASIQYHLALSDKSDKVKFYRGDFGNGVFDTTSAEKNKIIDGKGILDLKKLRPQTAGQLE